MLYLTAPMSPVRPLRGVWTEEGMAVFDPDDPLQASELVGLDELSVLGEWHGRVHPAACLTVEPSKSWHIQTWAQVAGQQYQHVMAQRRLVERLSKVGIRRHPEPYVMGRDDQPNMVELALILSYEELDRLLRRAGV